MKRVWPVALFVPVFALAIVAGSGKVHTIDEKACTQCGICVDTCPVKAISLVKKKGVRTHVIDSAKCTQCGMCAEACPVQAIKLVEKAPEQQPERK